MKNSIILALLACLCIIQSVKSESQISMASAFGCDTTDKIQIKDIISQCQCADGSSCIWTTGRRPVHGCPCPTMPVNPDYTCTKMADILGCSEKKIECTKTFGQCECADNKGMCVFAGQKAIAGCPCKGGRLPLEGEFDPKPEVPKQKTKKSKQDRQVDPENDL